MKKYILILLALVTVFSAVSCTSSKEETNINPVSSDIAEANDVECVLNPMEYTLYQNIFYNDMGANYEGQNETKEGIFTVVQDKYNNRTRYYVWGYSDNTLCCDWQWEIVPTDTSALPVPGSKVKATGTLTASEDALDGYWYTDASISALSNYTNNAGPYDLTTMSPTLARVQLVNMVNTIDETRGEKITVYGRIQAGNNLQHPYYDNTWSLALDYGGEIPPVGTYVTVSGILEGTNFDDVKIIVDSIIIDQ